MAFKNISSEAPRDHVGSSLYGANKHGGPENKRASVVETLATLKRILAILPEESKRKIGNKVELIRKDPEQAVEIIRNEIEANQALIGLLDNPISTEEALTELDKIFPKNNSVN